MLRVPCCLSCSDYCGVLVGAWWLFLVCCVCLLVGVGCLLFPNCCVVCVVICSLCDIRCVMFVV